MIQGSDNILIERINDSFVVVVEAGDTGGDFIPTPDGDKVWAMSAIFAVSKGVSPSGSSLADPARYGGGACRDNSNKRTKNPQFEALIHSFPQVIHRKHAQGCVRLRIHAPTYRN